MDTQNSTVKPRRLYFKTYLAMLRNSVGTSMFRNFYIEQDGQEVDALADGSNSCAFFVSSVLTLFQKHSGVHGTITSTLKDLQESGWQIVSDASMQPGDVVLWELKQFDDGMYEHIGFYLGEGRAVSTSLIEKTVSEHDVHFAEAQRAIKQVFRNFSWDD